MALVGVVLVTSFLLGWVNFFGGAQQSADLAISDFQMNPVFPKPGQEVRFTITVTNQGAGAVNDTFVVQFFAGRRIVSSRFVSSGLASGQSEKIEATWDAEAGEFRIRVVVDAFNKIFESNKENNSLIRVINVADSEPTQSDLTIKSLELQPANARPGEVAKIVANILNKGTGPAPALEIVFEADGKTVGTQKLEALAAGQELIVSQDWTVDIGERILRAKADPGAKIIELDETNNSLAKTIDSGPPPVSCAQQVFLEFEDASLLQLEDQTGLAHDAILSYFIPLIKRTLEKDFDGINVRFFYSRPSGPYTTILFDADNRPGILGLAPLDRGNFNKRDTAFVFIGSFVARDGLRNVALTSAPVMIGKVASHELGHALGLGHNAQGGIMNAEAELNPQSVEFESFRPEDLAYLRSILPLNC
jgi:hypothetical protein